MNIRKAANNDLSAIDDIYNQAIKSKLTADTEPLDIETRLKWFNLHEPDKYPVFVAEIDNVITGWLTFSPYRQGRNALIYTAEVSYYIHETYRRKGIGTELLSFALKKATEYNFKNLIAILLDNNTVSIKLLEKLKFEKWGWMPNVADFDGEKCGHLYYGLKISE